MARAGSSGREQRAFEPVARPRVVERIAEAAAYPLTLLAAPAGFGKSIALRQYLATIAEPVLRYEVETGARSILAFIRGLAGAVEPIAPSARTTVASAFEACRGMPGAGAELAYWFLEHLSGSTAAIVLDGVYEVCVADPIATDFIAALVERDAPGLRWIVATRAIGDLPVTSWMAYERLDALIDEQDLCFTLDEASACAAAYAALGPADVETIYALTRGWPAAFALAARGMRRSPAFADVATAPRQMVFRYLAEHVFRTLPEADREFLLRTAVFPSIDLAVLDGARFGDVRETIDRLRRHVPFVDQESDSVWQYQALFGEFLRYQLRGRGPVAYAQALREAGEILAGAGRAGAALGAFAAAGAEAELAGLLRRHAFELIERGEIDEVENAVAALPASERSEHPTILAVRAALESRAGDFSRADALFERAAQRAADPAERAQIAYWHALDLMKRNDPENRAALRSALDVLKRAVDGGQFDSELRTAACGAIATGYTMIGERSRAGELIERALALVATEDDRRLRALIYHQASWVAYVNGAADRSASLCASAAKLATELGLYSLVARSYSIRYCVAIELEDDPARALEFLAAMADAARRAGDRFLQVEALAGALDIHAERGDEPQVADLLERIAGNSPGTHVSSTAVPPARALRYAWEGAFARAYDLLSGTVDDQFDPLRRALRSAEIGLYAAAAGLRDEAQEAARAAMELSRAATPGNVAERLRAVRALALAALTLVVLGNGSSANAVLLELERSRRELSTRQKALLEAIRAAYLKVEIGADDGMTAALRNLGAAGYGGFARMLENLPLGGSASRSAIAQLTKAEIDILRALARGGSSTKVAADTNRSVNTVNAHVKSIMRKLGTATRHEAVSLAREQGLIL